MEEKKKKKGFFSSLFAPKSNNCCCCGVEFEEIPQDEAKNKEKSIQENISTKTMDESKES